MQLELPLERPVEARGRARAIWSLPLHHPHLPISSLLLLDVLCSVSACLCSLFVLDFLSYNDPLSDPRPRSLQWFRDFNDHFHAFLRFLHFTLTRSLSLVPYDHFLHSLRPSCFLRPILSVLSTTCPIPSLLLVRRSDLFPHLFPLSRLVTSLSLVIDLQRPRP